MHQVLFPLIIVNVLRNYGSEENPISITEMLNIINNEYAPFTDRDAVMNRSTVVRTLESLVSVTELGNFLDFRVIETGTMKRRKYFVSNA